MNRTRCRRAGLWYDPCRAAPQRRAGSGEIVAGKQMKKKDELLTALVVCFVLPWLALMLPVIQYLRSLLR